MMQSNKPSKTIVLFSIVLAATGFAFCILACYPGLMSPDSLDQYHQAKSGLYADWHPPIMAWIWSKLLWINDGPLPMMMLINLLYWSAVAIIAIKLKRFWLSCIFLVLSFSPPLINFIGLIWKDTLLFSFLFFISAVIFWLYNNYLNKFLSILLFLIITSLSFVAIMIRHNAASALIGILALAILVLFKNTKPIIALLLGFAFTLSLFFAGQKVNSKLCNHISQHPEQQMMLYDLLGISQQARINLFPAYLKNKITLDTIDRIYNHHDGGMYLIFAMHLVTENDMQLEQIKTAWKDALIQYPRFALVHKYENFEAVQKHPLAVKYSYIDPSNFDTAIITKNAFRKVFRDINESETAHKFYVPNDYFYGCLIIILISLIAYWKTKNQSLFLPVFTALSGFLYSGSYFLLSPCNELRYNYWTIGAFFLSFFFLLNAFTNRVTKRSQ